MAGVKGRSGRKARNREDELDSLFKKAADEEARETVVRVMVARASAGDMRATALFMGYAFGTPPSGDDLRVQEAVDDATETILKTLESSLTPSAWGEVERALGIDTD